jgi:hypothetical protein
VNPRHLAVVLSCLLVVAACLALAAAAVDDRAPARAAGPPEAVREGEALAVLRVWDDRRSRAWAVGDVDGLRRLYAPRSSTGGEDVAMLAAYVERGLRVTGLRMQVLSAAVAAWSPDRFTVVVTDRLTGGVAVARRTHLALPVDRPSTWRMSFVRVAGEWRVREVQASAAVSTASTSRSTNR